MDPTYSFRKAMVRRLLDGIGVAALAGPALALQAGCGRVVVDGAGGTEGEGAGGSRSSSGSGAVGGVGGAGGAATDGGSCTLPAPGAGGANGASGAGGAGGQIVQVTECIAPLANGCPNQYDAAQYITPSDCTYLVLVECGPVVAGGACCYLVEEQTHACPSQGRPFLIGGEGRTASPVDADGGWSDADVGASLTGLAGLDAAARAALGSAWVRDALVEHASVASFGRFALELMAVGAPADLVAQAHRAALDEVRHARLCFGLAEGYFGEPRAPSSFPFDGQVTVQGDLAAVAAATAREGCIGETLSALMAAEQLACATDPAVRRVLAILADDEARHAELAWRTVAWALERGGAPVRAAVLEVFGNAARHLPFGAGLDAGLDGGLDADVAAAHGRLGARAARQAMVRSIAEVILPCADALLAPRPEKGRAPGSGVRSARAPASSNLAGEPSPVTRRSPS